MQSYACLVSCIFIFIFVIFIAIFIIIFVIININGITNIIIANAIDVASHACVHGRQRAKMWTQAYD